MKELFIGGDPRFLSGCLAGKRASDYSSRPEVIPAGTPPGRLVTTESLGALPAGASLAAAVRQAGAAVHGGKSGYHHRPDLNLFLREGEWPSAGVELETEERLDISEGDLVDALRSNWFHFESDGSLVTGGHDGYELITEPLPPRYYRNPRLWEGLQNILSPWVESWGFRQTGLHVHVGTTQFEELGELSPYLVNSHDRRYFGKALTAYLYFCVVGRPFSDRVFLRKPGEYCHAPASADFAPFREGASGGDVMRSVLVSMFECDASNRSTERLQSSMDRVGSIALDAAGRPEELVRKACGIRSRGYSDDSSLRAVATGSHLVGHGSEINVQNEQTIEFRRGKGTLNGVSILRMVEFCTLLVRYAAKIVRNPDEAVCAEAIYAYMAENTTSEALRALAEAELNGKENRKCV